jgi:protein phosphatase
MRIGYMTDGGRRRPVNEDAVKVLEDVNFYMLADGVGGNRSGEIASQSALDALEKFIRHNPPEWLEGRDEIFRYLRAAVRYVNQFIIKLSESKPQYGGMATTLVFAYIRSDEMYVANVGDSRAYLYRDSYLEQVSKDHVETNDYAKNHRTKPALLQHLGIDPEEVQLEPTIVRLQVKRGDVILLCSDGLTDLVDHASIEKEIAAGRALSGSVHRLYDQAMEAGGIDNITIMLIAVN